MKEPRTTEETANYEPTTPAQAEASELKQLAIPFRGDTYIVPIVDEWSIETLEAFEAGKGVALLKRVLGPKQWNRFRKEYGKKKDVDALAEAIAEAGGFESSG